MPPDAPPPAPPTPLTGRQRLELAALLALAAVTLGWDIASRPLYDPDESRYAEIAREMWTSGDWIVPRLDTVPNLDKPPLLMWLGAAAIGLLGPGELAPRLAPFAASISVLLLLYAEGRRRWSHAAGLWAGAIWAASVMVIMISHMVSIDMILTAMTTASVVCFWRALDGGGRGALLGWAFAGLAFLAKGPVGFAIPAFAGAAWGLAHRSFPWRRLAIPLGAPLCLAVALPWYLALQRVFPTFFERFFVGQNLGGVTGEAHHRGAFYVPLMYALGGLLPWSLLAIPAAIRDREAWRAPAMRFLALWAAFIVGAFTLAVAKLAPYQLPALPALALAGGVLLSRSAPRRIDALPYSILASLAAVAVGMFLWHPWVVVRGEKVPIAPSGTAACAIFGASMIAAAVLAALGRSRAAALLTLAFVPVALVPAIAAVRATNDENRSTRDLVARHRPLLDRAELIQIGRTNYSTLYYLRRSARLGYMPNELEYGLSIEPSPLSLGTAGVGPFIRSHPRTAILIYADDTAVLGGLDLVEVDRAGAYALFATPAAVSAGPP